MKNSNLIAYLFFISSFLYAQTFEVGRGSEYTLNFQDKINSRVSIYIASSSFSKLGIEYSFTVPGSLIPAQTWQQYHFSILDKGPLAIDKGFIQGHDMDYPEILTAEYFNVNDGVKVNDFLFSKQSEIDASLVGNERIEVPAGVSNTTHYRKSRGGQVVDFWISENTKPIALVKLISKNPKNPNQNYTMELISLLKGVKAKIEPKKAKSLSSKGKAYLAKPLKNP